MLCIEAFLSQLVFSSIVILLLYPRQVNMGRKHTKHTRKAESSAARDQVLGIGELIYCICTHMDIQTLLNAQRVSKRWHDVISNSPTIYFRPCPSKKKRVINPLLLKHFKPILKPHRYQGQIYHYNLNVPEMSMTHMKNGRKVHKAFVRRGASWRNMLVAQPPITTIGYREQINDERQDYKAISFPEGLRMGVLYDMVFQAIFTRPGEASRHCCLGLDVRPHGNTDIERITGSLGETPGLMFTSVTDFYAHIECRLNRCPCHGLRRTKGICVYIRDRKDFIRAKNGIRWMFECEEFEETDYLSLGQRI